MITTKEFSLLQDVNVPIDISCEMTKLTCVKPVLHQQTLDQDKDFRLLWELSLGGKMLEKEMNLSLRDGERTTKD